MTQKIAYVTGGAANKAAMGFPTIPGLPADAPNGLVNPLLDYDWGLNDTDIGLIMAHLIRSRRAWALSSSSCVPVPATR